MATIGKKATKMEPMRMYLYQNSPSHTEDQLNLALADFFSL